MGLRWPLSRGSQFKLHFYLGWRGNHAKVSTSPFFEGLLINNIELRDILTRTKYMAMQNDLKWNDEFTSQKIRMAQDY